MTRTASMAAACLTVMMSLEMLVLMMKRRVD